MGAEMYDGHIPGVPDAFCLRCWGMHPANRYCACLSVEEIAAWEEQGLGPPWKPAERACPTCGEGTYDYEERDTGVRFRRCVCGWDETQDPELGPTEREGEE